MRDNDFFNNSICNFMYEHTPSALSPINEFKEYIYSRNQKNNIEQYKFILTEIKGKNYAWQKIKNKVEVYEIQTCNFHLTLIKCALFKQALISEKKMILIMRSANLKTIYLCGIDRAEFSMYELNERDLDDINKISDDLNKKKSKEKEKIKKVTNKNLLKKIHEICMNNNLFIKLTPYYLIDLKTKNVVYRDIIIDGEKYIYNHLKKQIYHGDYFDTNHFKCFFNKSNYLLIMQRFKDFSVKSYENIS